MRSSENSAGPLVVRARLDINQIDVIDDSTENFEVSGVMTLSWQDPRQAFDPALEGVAEKNVKRQPFYMMRLIVFPLFVIVLLSFTVFWMDRSSLGDRVSISFIGLLTAVAYLMVTGDNMPRIGYVTLIHGFLNLSLIIMAITVMFNLIVGALEQKGEAALALRIDHRCRWAFPLA